MRTKIFKNNQMTETTAIRQRLTAACQKFKLRGNEVLIYECIFMLADIATRVCDAHVGTLSEYYQERFGATPLSYSATASILKRLTKKGALKTKRRGVGLSNLYELTEVKLS